MILKYHPCDFIVKEEAPLQIREYGLYSYWLVKKRDMTTMQIVLILARSLHIKDRSIGFAGTKDKKAVTEQYFSLKGINKEKMISFSYPAVTVTFVGYGDHPISLGDLRGNTFMITIRDVGEQELRKMLKQVKGKSEYGFLNLFGEQRFSDKNAFIGKMLLKKKYHEAVLKLLESTGEHEMDVSNYLTKHPTDFVGALKTIPRKILLLYLHAYQSLLWNEYAPLLEQERIPLLGFGTQFDDHEKKIILPIMQREEITFRDFINPSFPELTLEGSERKKWCLATRFTSMIDNDDEFPGKKKVTLSFFLPKGCYATILCRLLFS